MKIKNTIYKNKRYWYHVSTTLTKKTEYLTPWDGYTSVNRSQTEPEGARICVSPTIEQCITAIPYNLNDTIAIYRTEKKVKPEVPHSIFDSNVTNEGWLTSPTKFKRIGYLDFQKVEDDLKIDHIISQSASSNEPKYAGKVLRWWQKARIKRCIQK